MMINTALNRRILFLMGLPGVGSRRAEKLISAFTAPEAQTIETIVKKGIVLDLLPDTLTETDIRLAEDEADEILLQCSLADIHLISRFDAPFPDCMQFSDGPIMLYYQGNLNALKQPLRAAVIGTRYPQNKGDYFAYHIGKMLAEADHTVISGLALGCDSAGHRGCLDGGGETVAFMPGGLTSIYPPQNTALSERILRDGGLLVSEYSPKEPLSPYMFVQRDRLQAAASEMIFCSEFAEDSGTIHTLTYAKKYNRPIYSLENFADSISQMDVLTQNNITIKTMNLKDLQKIIAQRKIFKENQ